MLNIDKSLDCDRSKAKTWEKFDRENFEGDGFQVLTSHAHGTATVYGQVGGEWGMTNRYPTPLNQLIVEDK